ncbi:MAG TPA: protein kinase, partial [Ktedonobacteraceae bacterium]|nr:protein kinase [Ktedonobacteraceae bacterium]
MQKHFHHYSLTERLASKPLRSVYLAHHVSDVSQEVVVKIFDSRCLKLEQESKSLLQKVEWVKQFTHAHIVPVLDLGIEQGQPYIVSSYQSSGSLRDRLDRLAPERLDLQDALPIIFQVGRALRYAHQQNILHGNIKPENIFFNKLGEALLADFRLADLIDVTKLDYKSDPHSTCYMAPEQFSGTISEKSDQYGLACLAYELITGRTPFAIQGFSPMWTKQDTERAIPLSDLVPDLPEQAEEVVLKAMAKDPSERYANISIFIRALEALSLLPTALSTSVSTSPPMMALRSDTPVRSMAESLETLATVGPAMRLSDAPVTTRLLERSEYVNNEHNTNKTLDTPPSQTPHKRSSKTLHRPSSKILHTPSSKPSDTPSSKILDMSPSKTSDTPSSKTSDTPSSKTSDTPSSKTSDTPSSKTSDMSPSKALATLAEEAHVESLTKGGLPQSRKPLTPTLWVAFALSGLVILMGAILPYLLVPFHSPGSSNAGKS